MPDSKRDIRDDLLCLPETCKKDFLIKESSTLISLNILFFNIKYFKIGEHQKFLRFFKTMFSQIIFTNI